MCVISLSRAGETVPTINQFQQMWDKNPHGAGIIVDDGEGEVYYIKGLMTFENFMKEYNRLAVEYNLTKAACAFHFRIKTTGNTDAPTTHPFVLSPRYQDLRQLEYKGRTPVMMHNGTVPRFGGWLDALSSDTQDYAATIGYSLLRRNRKGAKPSKTALKAADAVIGGSRLVVFYGDAEPVTLGDWKTVEGLCTSNDLWPKREYASTAMATYKKPEADAFGMYTDTYPMVGREWIRYSNKKEMERLTYSLKDVIEDGVTKLVSRTQYYGVDKKEYMVEGLDIFTEAGAKLRDQAQIVHEIGKAQEEIELTEDDYIAAEEPEEFWDELSRLEYVDAEMTYRNAVGDILYVDYASNEAYTEKALKVLYDKYARHARRDLLINGMLTVDWTNPSETELKSLKQAAKDTKGKPVDWGTGLYTNEMALTC